MTKEQLAAFLSLMMCSDPSPLTLEQDAELLAFADQESGRHGYGDWIEAYHALNQPLSAPVIPATL